MLSTLNEPESDDAWTQLAPLLSTTLAQLGEKDHDAIVLRFFDGKNMNEVGTALGVSENTAKTRVSRAVERLRKIFMQRGVTLSTAVIGCAISANSIQAAPIGLATSVTVAAAKGTVVATSTSTLITTTLKIMAWTKMKTAVVVGAAVILATGTTALVVQQQRQPQAILIAGGQTQFPKASWGFAGYSDPQSAFLSAVWARSKPDLKVYLASLTPEQEQREQEDIRRQTGMSGKSAEQVAAQIAERDFEKTTGFRIVDVKTISNDQVVLHLFIEGDEHEANAKIRKIANEWKFDGFERTNQRFQP
jgi:hypothetical protein